ncbi:hypothetical protein K445DRAFT_318750 [Daldinia sp. EC12]|nr:hypothetical protein K445DRAFT_318750 [Daldinia sp. EC12]
MPRSSYVTSSSSGDAFYQLARVADTLHNNSLERVDLLEAYIDHELEERSTDFKNALEKVNTTIQSLQENANDASGRWQSDDGMITCLSLLQAQTRTLHENQNGFWAAFKDLKCKIAGIRSNQCSLRDVLRMMRADAQLLRQPTDTFGFPQFKRLPPEIRTMIWGLAIPNRILGLKGSRLRDYDEYYSMYNFDPGLSPPSVAHVCREARSIACRSGRLVSIRNYRECPYPNLMDEGHVARPEWSWYDPSRDSLRLPVKTLVGSPNTTILEITECTQFVISGVDSNHTHCYRLLAYLSDPYYFPRLKVVDLISDVYQHPQLSDHVLETQLFGLDQQNFFSLDIDDKAAKKALIYRIKKDNTSAEANKLASWLEEDKEDYWNDLNRTTRVRNLKWPHFLDHLKKGWILAKGQRNSSDDTSHVPKRVKKSSKKRDKLTKDQEALLLQSLPAFRRVKLIERIAARVDRDDRWASSEWSE